METFVKKIIQLLIYLFTLGNWGKAYLEKNRFDDAFVNRLIKSKKKRKMLKVYVKNHPLNDEQISQILQMKGEISLKQDVLRKNVLQEKEQELLVSNNNVLLLDAYLCPDGYYLKERAFSLKAEFLFLSSLIEKNNLMGFEIFKTYIANNVERVLTMELLNIIVGCDNQLSRHILLKARLSREQEEFLVGQASNEMLEFYVRNCRLGSETAQHMLVDKNFELASIHFQRYGLCCKARALYYTIQQ